MYTAIETKYLGPTNHKGARIRASAAGKSITVPYSYEGSPSEEHARAAELLARKLGWAGVYHGGETAKGYVFVASTSVYNIGDFRVLP